MWDLTLINLLRRNWSIDNEGDEQAREEGADRRMDDAIHRAESGIWYL